jgi:hypothetical protein
MGRVAFGKTVDKVLEPTPLSRAPLELDDDA